MPPTYDYGERLRKYDGARAYAAVAAMYCGSTHGAHPTPGGGAAYGERPYVHDVAQAYVPAFMVGTYAYVTGIRDTASEGDDAAPDEGDDAAADLPGMVPPEAPGIECHP
jgi:hypothetical protein